MATDSSSGTLPSSSRLTIDSSSSIARSKGRPLTSMLLFSAMLVFRTYPFGPNPALSQILRDRTQPIELGSRYVSIVAVSHGRKDAHAFYARVFHCLIVVMIDRETMPFDRGHAALRRVLDECRKQRSRDWALHAHNHTGARRIFQRRPLTAHQGSDVGSGRVGEALQVVAAFKHRDNAAAGMGVGDFHELA